MLDRNHARVLLSGFYGLAQLLGLARADASQAIRDLSDSQVPSAAATAPLRRPFATLPTSPWLDPAPGAGRPRYSRHSGYTPRWG